MRCPSQTFWSSASREVSSITPQCNTRTLPHSNRINGEVRKKVAISNVLNSELVSDDRGLACVKMITPYDCAVIVTLDHDRPVILSCAKFARFAPLRYHLATGPHDLSNYYSAGTTAAKSELAFSEATEND